MRTPNFVFKLLTSSEFLSDCGIDTINMETLT